MKKMHLILLIMICCASNDIANDIEKQWCIDTFWKLYGEIPVVWEEGERELTFSFHESILVYEDNFQIKLDSASFRMQLLANDEDYLKVCKIWFEEENIK